MSESLMYKGKGESERRWCFEVRTWYTGLLNDWRDYN